jgi:DMSO/TMAO reductase YedYZ molybdopterin-dependent catalytic subunit
VTTPTRPAGQLPGGVIGARVSTWRDQAADDPRHDERTAALLGLALGVCFTICFLTGLYSHLAQHPTSWFHLPARPAGLYRVTQGLHVLTGIATIPLLLAKLWAVFPKLLQWPPVTSVAHLLERVSLVPLVAGALFQLWTGLADIDLWYPLPSFFPTVHYWTAWITMGALVVHVSAKITTTRSALARGGGVAPAGAEPRPPVPVHIPTVIGAEVAEPEAPVPPDRPEVAARRRFLTAAAATSGLLVITVAGQTIGPLRRLALLAPRHPDIGVQGFPVNKSAISAGVRHTATSPDYRLEVVGRVARPLSLAVHELRALPQRSATLPIACVEGWSANRRWTGVSMGELLARAGAPAGAAVTVHSLEAHGLYAQAEVDSAQAGDPDTLLALLVEGRPLALDHGYPVRLIGPDRPGVMQTKWVTRIVVR